MNKYEILFILKSELNEEGVKNVIKGIADSVVKNGGEVTKEENWGKKQLVYPVKKAKDGYYFKLDFIAPASAVEKIEAGHRLNADILRTMVTKR